MPYLQLGQQVYATITAIGVLGFDHSKKTPEGLLGMGIRNFDDDSRKYVIRLAVRMADACDHLCQRSVE